MANWQLVTCNWQMATAAEINDHKFYTATKAKVPKLFIQFKQQSEICKINKLFTGNLRTEEWVEKRAEKAVQLNCNLCFFCPPSFPTPFNSYSHSQSHHIFITLSLTSRDLFKLCKTTQFTERRIAKLRSRQPFSLPQSAQQ